MGVCTGCSRYLLVVHPHVVYAAFERSFVKFCRRQILGVCGSPSEVDGSPPHIDPLPTPGGAGDPPAAVYLEAAPGVLPDDEGPVEGPVTDPVPGPDDGRY